MSLDLANQVKSLALTRLDSKISYIYMSKFLDSKTKMQYETEGDNITKLRQTNDFHISTNMINFIAPYGNNNKFKFISQSYFI